MKPRCLLALFVAFMVAGVCGLDALAQREVVLTPVKDNTLYESAVGPLSNGAGMHLFAGKTRIGFARRAVLAFDVAGAVPSGAVLDSVRLTLHLSKTAGEAHTVAVHRLLMDWGEGTSDASDNEGEGTDATPGDATWLHAFFDTTTWQRPGGDFAPVASASVRVAGEGDYAWGSTPELVADVQAWLDAPEENVGWILLGDENVIISTKRFDSRDHPDSTARPALYLFFSVPTSVETEELPATLHLAQNYPNPFSRTTTISYALSTPQAVRLEVYDLLGRKVATLTQGWQSSGLHQIPFDAGGLPEGVYIYLIMGDHFRQNRRMVMLR